VLPAGQELWASASPALRAAARAWMRAYARLRRRRELLDQRPAADGLVLLRLVLRHSGVAVGIHRRHLHGTKRSGRSSAASDAQTPSERAGGIRLRARRACAHWCACVSLCAPGRPAPLSHACAVCQRACECIAHMHRAGACATWTGQDVRAAPRARRRTGDASAARRRRRRRRRRVRGCAMRRSRSRPILLRRRPPTAPGRRGARPSAR
jgi:hypothetical protein